MRARSLKPSIFKNELLAVVDPLYTVIFEGLWCLADREGRLEDRPARIHMEINPGRSFDGTSNALNWLSENGFILRYQVGLVKLVQVIAFVRHQKPHQNEVASVLPPPNGESYAINSQADLLPRNEVKADQGAKDLALNPSSLTPDSLNLTPDSPFTGPADLDPNAWRMWLEYRRKIRKPLKEPSIPAAMRKLAAFGTGQAAVVEQSIANGWQGLFDLKSVNGTTGPEHKTKFDRAMEAIDRG